MLNTTSIKKPSSKKEESSKHGINSHIQQEMGITVDDKLLLQQAEKIVKKKGTKFQRALSLVDLSAKDMKPEIKEECEKEWSSTFVTDSPKGILSKITPNLAHYLVKFRTPNNRLSKGGRLRDYEKSMKNGRWNINGQGIVINTIGDVEDGGHRLTACYNSQESEAFDGFSTMVLIGQAVGSHETIDRGAPRTMSDDMEFEMELSKLLGITSNRAASPVISEVGSWIKAIYDTSRTLNWREDNRSKGKDGGGHTNPHQPLRQTKLDFMNTVWKSVMGNERLQKSILYFEKLTRQLPVELTVPLNSDKGRKFKFIRLKAIAVPLVQYHYLQPTKAEIFIDKLISGKDVSDEKVQLPSDLSLNSAARTLREYILTNRQGITNGGIGKKANSSNRTFNAIYHRIVSAINADFDDRDLSNLRETKIFFRDWKIPTESLDTDEDDNPIEW